jgi:hypothetical protein
MFLLLLYEPPYIIQYTIFDSQRDLASQVMAWHSTIEHFETEKFKKRLHKICISRCTEQFSNVYSDILLFCTEHYYSI